MVCERNKSNIIFDTAVFSKSRMIIFRPFGSRKLSETVELVGNSVSLLLVDFVLFWLRTEICPKSCFRSFFSKIPGCPKGRIESKVRSQKTLPRRRKAAIASVTEKPTGNEDTRLCPHPRR